MKNCDFYQSNTQNLKGKEINLSQQQHSVSNGLIVWCTHKHSPATKDHSRSVIGGGSTILPCGGDFERCTISSEKFMDVMPD